MVDRWGTAAGHERFMETFENDYAALSKETAELYEEEELLGAFVLLA